MFKFKELPYAYDALEPYIDAKTMEVHYDKHHRAYHSKFVNAIKGTQFANMDSMPQVFANIDEANAAIRNNGGGYFNHEVFWACMHTKGGGKPGGKLAKDIDQVFGSFDAFQELFANAAANRFGSGWAWLVLNQQGNLEVCSTPNQDNPLMKDAPVKGEPILALDVWEHAYYLKYQNRRPEYVDAFWNVVNWSLLEEKYSAM